MNYYYLMKFISYSLHTIVKRYSDQNKILESFCGRPNFHDQPIAKEIVAYAISVMDHTDVPLLVSVNHQLIYGLVPIPECYFIIGPNLLSTPVYFREQIEVNPFDPKWSNTVRECDLRTFTKHILLAYNLFRDKELKQYDFYTFNCLSPEADKEVQKFYSQLIFQNIEEGRHHNPYDQEVREMLSIETGDIESLKKSIQEDFIEDVGVIAKTPLRNLKNIGIAVISLACRAAIRGGLIPEIAYSLCDSYILQIEELNDMPTLSNLIRSAEFRFTEMVHELQELKNGSVEKGVNLHIEHCKNYIFSHLHEKITAQEIAERLGIQPNYLSALFRKCEGVALSDFIQKEKINLAKNMLIYSNYSYSEIATYLGYASQSHLGRHFKQVTGSTLGSYRKNYGVKKFLE